MSLDDIPGLGTGGRSPPLLPPGPRRRPRRWLHCLVWIGLWTLSWALCLLAGFVLGRYTDTLLELARWLVGLG